LLTEGLHIVVTDERLAVLEQSIAELTKLVKSLKADECSIGDWIPEDEVLRISQLGKTTLYNLRKEGALSFSTISGRGVFYRKSDLIKILDGNEKRNER
jgi:hypothetical protein